MYELITKPHTDSPVIGRIKKYKTMWALYLAKLGRCTCLTYEVPHHHIGLWTMIYFESLGIEVGFSCDQAALWMVQSVRPSVCSFVCPSVCPSVRLLGGWHFIAPTAIKPPKAACQFGADDILLYEFCYYNPMDFYFTVWKKEKKNCHHYNTILSLYISYQDITRRVW